MKKITCILCVAVFGHLAKAQEIRPIITGVPFLTITADARAAAMGDMGVATSFDTYSQSHNPAKYAFATINQGFSLSYTPYMSKVSSGMSLGQLTYFNKFNERSAIGASLKYFGMGDIQLRSSYDSAVMTKKPNEFSVDVSYALKLSEKFSLAIAARFINSDLKVPGDFDSNSSASSIAADVAGFYQSDVIRYSNFDGRFRAGFNIKNLGSKIKYDDSMGQGDFLPTNLTLGAGFDFILDPQNTFTVTGQAGKLLVPTPPDRSTGMQGYNAYNDISWIKGVFESFGDAPGGFSEEMKEIVWSLGVEYMFDKRVALRAGYFHESQDKGDRQFATIGAGFRYQMVTIDLSYLFSTSNINNPLENTLRFSLSFDLERKKYSRF